MARPPQHKIVVIGGGGHAKVVISILKKTAWEILGYTDSQNRGAILGARHLGVDVVLPEILRTVGCRHAVIALGKIDTSARRIQLQDNMEALGFEFPVIVSSRAVVNEDVELGPGTVVLDAAVVNSGTVAGRGCIINTNATVEHDCRLGDDVHVAPGATLSGGVSVGSHCLIGVGANVLQGLTISPDCLVGAGATVIRDIDLPGTYVGVPASRIK